MEQQQYDYEAARKKRRKIKTIIIVSAVTVAVFLNFGLPLIYLARAKSGYKEKQTARKYGESLTYEEFKEKFDYRFDNLGIFDDEGHADSFKIEDVTKRSYSLNMRRDGNAITLRYKTEKEKETNKVTTTYDFANEIKERKVNDTSYTAFVGKGQNEISRKNNKSQSHSEAYKVDDQKKVIEINKIEGTYLTKGTVAEDKTYADTLYLESSLNYLSKFHYSGYITDGTSQGCLYYHKNDTYTVIKQNVSYNTTSSDGYNLSYSGKTIYTFKLKDEKPSVKVESELKCSTQYNAKGTGGDNTYFFFDAQASETKKVTFKKFNGSLKKEDITKYRSKD